MRALRDGILAIVAGLLLAAAFPNLGVWFLAPIAVAVITWVQWRARAVPALVTGFLFGLTFFLALMPWLRVIGTDAWIAASVFCALWTAVLGWATGRLSRLPGAVVWIGFAWVAMEAGRENVPTLGFTWGRLAFAQGSSPLGNAAPWIGAAGITLLVALLGALLAQAGRADTWPRTLLPAGVAVGILVIVAVIPAPSLPTQGVIRVALIQGGTPQTGLGETDVRREVLANHASVTEELARAVEAGEVVQPDVVLWPENSVDIDPFQSPETARVIDVASRSIGVPILVGAVIDDPTDPDYRANVTIEWDPAAGPQQMYVKQRLVPFGEFIPLRSLIAERIERLERIPRDFAPGDEPGLFEVAGTPIGNVICFEVAYDAAIAQVLERGAQVLTVQTNNSTWAGMNQINQQLGIERLRAREAGRALAVAATTGATVAYDPVGKELASIPIDDVGSTVADLPRVSAKTPATVVTPWISLGSVALTLLGLALTWTRVSRRNEVRVGR